ncbi:MAG: 16S rRNA (cytosine(1402)-N(4))-methyltransferase RsmH [Muribaculaceae bacterium]|nr:16S rRNA (cytosine(1402)-N(4))-methyltransferase RsmH [Muribaculaceae bacterium]
MSEEVYHIPALLGKSIEGLMIKPDGTYVDVTFGGGGHSRAIMEQLGKGGHLFGFDQDLEAQANAIADSRFTFVHSNFAYLRNFLRYYGVNEVNGIIADLGVSFHHFDDAERGFSFRFDAPLDMRMNRSATLTASDVLNSYSEERLAEVLYLYGELRQSRRIAAAVVRERNRNNIATASQLLTVVEPFIAKAQEKKELAQLFQALRIEVNHEIDVLKKLLEQSGEVLCSGGRLVVITYHSLEDRLVKNFIRSGNVEGKVEKDFFGKSQAPFKAINNKVIVPSDEEIERNPRSRSAKLRIEQKV